MYDRGVFHEKSTCIDNDGSDCRVNSGRMWERPVRNNNNRRWKHNDNSGVLQRFGQHDSSFVFI